ncbi:PIN domain-containing protein [Chroococcidiopsis sp. CCNUC1]|uniref:PIN domain-containing protein n=1 Tax=Chroococcidiopsis sp. CCNUC1 TaxID=2653189 RepID=UPI00202175F3|nr:PIN domain-containing protein [Chroococcidiopsis sp. CCNUC1]URD53548.1 PIN domain-containing protein [Chroococcidiopsis sp. CCNUC1]
MRLVVDVNILVSELIRKRGRDLIVHPELELYIAQMAWEETCHELGKRVERMVQKGVFSQEVGQNLLIEAIAPS